MNQDRLYYQHPYVKTFTCVVESCQQGKNDTWQVTLNQTGFYPEGGGQPADQGTLGGVKVLDVHEKVGVVYHETEAPLKVGETVEGVVDWERRFANMQGHTGEHILSGLIHARYGYDNVGFHMSDHDITVDFNGILTWEQLEELEEEANQRIFANLPVEVLYPDGKELEAMDYRSKKELSGQVRIVTVPGTDTCACCGTHVEKTGEVGMIKITNMIHYKGGVRLTMVCGRKALWDYQRRVRIDTRISNLLSAKPEQLDQAVEKLKKDGQEKDQLISGLRHQLFEWKASGFPDSVKPLAVFEKGLDPAGLRQFCNLLCQGDKGSCILACSPSGREGEYFYVLASKTEDMRQLSKRLNGRLSGRGGGSAQMAQGSWRAEREQIEQAFLEELKWN